MKAVKVTKGRKITNIFAGVSFLHDMGSDMVFPIWPLFVTVFLGANLAVLGFVDGLGTAAVSLSGALSGYLSDRWRKRKPFIWTGYGMGGVARFGYAVAPSWPWLIPLKLLDRAGKIRSAPRDAIVSDVSTDAERCGNFGLLRSADHMGAVVGIVVTLILFSILHFNYFTIFTIAAIPSFLSVVLVLVYVKESSWKKKLAKAKGECAVEGPGKRTYSFWEFSRNFKVLTVVSVLFSLGYFSYSFLIVFANNAGIPVGLSIALYLLFTMVAMVLSYPLGQAADKVGRKNMLLLAFVLFGFMCIGFIFVGPAASLPMIILMLVLYGAHLGAFEPVQKAFVSEVVRPEQKASGLGIYQMAIGFTSLPASLLAGILWETFGTWATFTFSAVTTIGAILGLALVTESRRKV